MTDSRTPSDKWKRHWDVDPNTGTSRCGVFPAIPARDVLEVDCKRCMRDPDYQAALEGERDLREHALSDEERLAWLRGEWPSESVNNVIDFVAARQRREGVTV